MVYLDGIRVRGVDVLRHISVSDVQSISYLDALTATIRYGTNHTGGAILVVTQRGG